jgi:hypothetical protein
MGYEDLNKAHTGSAEKCQGGQSNRQVSSDWSKETEIWGTDEDARRVVQRPSGVDCVVMAAIIRCTIAMIFWLK